MRIFSKNRIVNSTRGVSIYRSSRNRFFSIKLDSEDSVEYLLKFGIQNYENMELCEAFSCFKRVTQNKVEGDHSSVLDKAIAHLYLAKINMLTSSSGEWLGIQNLKTSKALFLELKKSDQTKSENYKKFEKEMKAEYTKIKIYYGGIKKYEKNLERLLKSFGNGFLESVESYRAEFSEEVITGSNKNNSFLDLNEVDRINTALATSSPDEAVVAYYKGIGFLNLGKGYEVDALAAFKLAVTLDKTGRYKLKSEPYIALLLDELNDESEHSSHFKV